MDTKSKEIVKRNIALWRCNKFKTRYTCIFLLPNSALHQTDSKLEERM